MIKRIVTMAVLIGALGLGICLAEEEVPPVRPLATAQALLEYPTGVVSERTDEERLYVVILPETELAVIIRPMTEAEYGSFQIQAISAQMIDQQMLAATIVLPAVAPEDVAGFSTQLIRVLQEAINRISGFAVFSGLLLP